MTDIHGVDVSHHQGERGAPMREIAAAGGQFVIAKATEGTTPDPAFPFNVKRAQRAGLLLGCYHFAYGSDDPAKQANAFIRTIEAQKLDPKAIGLVIDAERPRGYPELPWPVIRGIGERVNKLVGDEVPLGLYTSSGYWRAIGNPDATGVFDWLWAAYYTLNHQPLQTWDTSSVHFAAGWGGFGRAFIMQPGPVSLTEKSKNYIDGDVFRGALEDLRTLFSVKPPVPPPDVRKLYVDAFNVFLDSVIANTRVLAGAAVPATEDARTAALAELETLRITEPAA